MKKTILLLLLALFQICTICAQPYAYKSTMGIHGHFRDFRGIPNGERDSTDFNFAFGGYLGLYLNPSFRLGLNAAFVPVKGNDNSINSITELSSSLNYTFNNGYIIKRNASIAPFLRAGIGTYMDESLNERQFFVPLGGGFDLNLGNTLALQIQGAYKKGVSENAIDFASVIVGLNTYMGVTILKEDVRKQRKPKKVKEPKIASVNKPIATEPEPESKGRKRKIKLKPTKDDLDGDGIMNEEDECPDDPGLITAKGCPDQDHDDVPDSIDECPEEEGLAINKGCPNDIDHDGIRDGIDRCPKAAGIEYHKGCPDSDFDNIPDIDDECPKEYGHISMKGCPDMDGDGITDKDDKCPRQAGLVIRDGCPIFPELPRKPKAKEKAKESLVNGTKVTAMGRPYQGEDDSESIPFLLDEVESVLNMATQNVRFESNSARLKQQAYPMLDGIIKVMKNKPDYSLKIIGHTDSDGEVNENQRLSERRARTCKDYLIKKGIASRRIHTVGYGETQPLTENNSPSAKAKNQRVEFRLFIR